MEDLDNLGEIIFVKESSQSFVIGYIGRLEKDIYDGLKKHRIIFRDDLSVAFLVSEKLSSVFSQSPREACASLKFLD